MKRSSRDTPYKIVFLVVSVPQTHALWRLILSEPQKMRHFLMSAKVRQTNLAMVGSVSGSSDVCAAMGKTWERYAVRIVQKTFPKILHHLRIY